MTTKVLAAADMTRLLEVVGRDQFMDLMIERLRARFLDHSADAVEVRTRDGFLEITGVPAKPKLGMDSYAGWFGYLMQHDVLFVKRYKTFSDRVYNEVAGLTISIWYPEGKRVELEPIGPRERLQPGESASFKEEWWLLPYEFPNDGEDVDLSQVKRVVDAATKATQP